MTVIWLIINNEKKLVLKFLLFSLIGLLVILFVYSNIFHYKFLYANTIKALQNRIDLSWFYTDIFKRSINSIWILPIYAACLIGIKNHFKPRSTEDKALAALFLVQIVFSLGTSLKWGSSAGYLNESFVLSFIIIAREISSSIVVTKLKYAPKIILFLTPLLVLFAIHTNAQGYLFFIQNRAAKKEAYEQQKEVSNYLQAKLDGHYVIDQSWPGQNFFKADLSKELAVPNVDIVGCCTFPDKTFNYSKLANDITDGNIKYIIQADTILPHELWGGSLQHFTRDTTIHGFVIFRYHEPNNLP